MLHISRFADHGLPRHQNLCCFHHSPFHHAHAHGNPLPGAAIPYHLSTIIKGRDSHGSQGLNETILGTVPLSCVYSVSGAYIAYQRILFYLVIFFTFLSRSHQWLWTAAMAYLLSVTGTAALHGIILAGQKHVGSDADQYMAHQILAIASFASVIFYMHSPRIFQVNTRPYVLAWSLWVVVANIALEISQFRFQDGLNRRISAQVCGNMTLCQDYCNESPIGALFRSHDTLSPWNLSKFQANGTNTTNSGMLVGENSGDSTHKLQAQRIVLSVTPGLYAIGIGISLLMQTTSVNLWLRQGQARNSIVRYLTSKHIGLPAVHSSFQCNVAYTILTEYSARPMEATLLFHLPAHVCRPGMLHYLPSSFPAWCSTKSHF